jgi:hypothetical protein
MSAEIFAVHGMTASDSGTAMAEALIALCDEASPSEHRSWLLFHDTVDNAAATHVDKIISLAPTVLGDFDPGKTVSAPLDGPSLALFEPLPEAPTRNLSRVMIDATGDEPWIRPLVENLLGKYTLTAASRDPAEIAERFRTEGVWSPVAPRRKEWIDLVSRHDLVVTGNPFTAALANGVLKPVLFVGEKTVTGLLACLAAELDDLGGQLSGLDMVAMGADLLNAKRRAHQHAVDLVRDVLGGAAT